MDVMVSNDVQLYVEGPDVAEERRRVESLGRGDASTAIVLRDLCKVYPAEVGHVQTQTDIVMPKLRISAVPVVCRCLSVVKWLRMRHSKFWRKLQGGNPPKVAVECLNLAISRGEVFGLLGPNGAGKTSAINMLVGLLEPSAGADMVMHRPGFGDPACLRLMAALSPCNNLAAHMLTHVICCQARRSWRAATSGRTWTASTPGWASARSMTSCGMCSRHESTSCSMAGLKNLKARPFASF